MANAKRNDSAELEEELEQARVKIEEKQKDVMNLKSEMRTQELWFQSQLDTERKRVRELEAG